MKKKLNYIRPALTSISSGMKESYCSTGNTAIGSGYYSVYCENGTYIGVNGCRNGTRDADYYDQCAPSGAANAGFSNCDTGTGLDTPGSGCAGTCVSGTSATA